MTEFSINPVNCEWGILSRADGSARVSQGKTSVLASINGAIPTKNELVDSAFLSITVRPPNHLPGPAEKQIESFLFDALRDVVLLSRFPFSEIAIVVQIFCDDGSLISIAHLCCILALMDAGIPLKTMPMMVTIAVDANHSISVFPTSSEEKEASVLIHASFDPPFTKTAQLRSFHCVGLTDLSMFANPSKEKEKETESQQNLLVVAEQASKTLYAFVKTALKKWNEVVK